ncbi:MAG TPA: adenylate/guanylate cyclase domain-containing protein [Burkholderiaceae bacterium]
MSLPAARNPISVIGLIRIGIGLLAVLITVWAESAPGWDFASEWLRDRFSRLHASRTIAASDEKPSLSPLAARDKVESNVDQRILLVDIDEASLAELGPWPWPRKHFTKLVENLLTTYQARGVALDVVLPEPTDAEGDLRLGILAQNGPVVMAQAFEYGPQNEALRVGKLTGGIAPHPGMTLVPASGYMANHAGLAQAAHLGNIGFVPDPDGSLRRLPLYTGFEGRAYPTLALALFDCCAEGGNGAIRTDAEGYVRVPFERDWSTYEVARASDIVQERIPASRVSGRLVVLGSSSLGLTDRVATPLLVNTPGFLVHAALLSALLDQRDGRAPVPLPGSRIAILFSIAATLATGYIFSRRSAAASAASLAAAALLWLAIAYWLGPHDLYFSTSGPLASILFLLAVAVPFNWQIAQRRSRRLLGTLRQYVAGEVVDELLQSDLQDPLAPRQLQVTTLIADMEAYTSHVESLSMEDAARVTRDFLDCLTRPVLERHGTLDKYTGDGLVAFWGAPLPNPDHADLALDAAQAIVEAVREFSDRRARAGLTRLRVRIGVESGQAMAGDFGTAFRSIYTAVGDSVNVASRLEDAARDLPHDIVVGQGTAALVRRHRLIALGERQLRGKGKPTALYALDSAPGSAMEGSA